MYVIPVDNSQNNTFKCTVPVDGKAIKFKFRFSFNSEAGYWYMDIYKSDNTPLLSSIPLVCGCNLLDQYTYMEIGSAYLVKTDKTFKDDIPNMYTLGTKFKLVWGNTEENEQYVLKEYYKESLGN